MMGTRQKLKIGTEYDAIYARHMYKYLKEGSHAIKKDLSRRRRRKHKLTLDSNV